MLDRAATPPMRRSPAAAMAVTSPHMCGLGGDLFAVVVAPAGAGALNASGRAGSGADPAQLRAEGMARMPFAMTP